MLALVLACSLPPIPSPSETADPVPAPDQSPRPNVSASYDVDVQPRTLAATYAGALDCDADPEAELDAPLGTITVVAYEDAPVHLSILATFEDVAMEDPAASWLDASVADDVSWSLSGGVPLQIPVHAIGGCADGAIARGEHRFEIEVVAGELPYVTSYLLEATITLE